MKKAEAQKIIDAMFADEAKEKEIKEKYGLISEEYFAFLKSPEHIQAEQDFISLAGKKFDE